MTDYGDQISEVKAAFEDFDVTVDESAVQSRLETLIDEYSVPQKEAVRSAIRKIGEEHDVDPLGLNSDGPSEGGAETVDVASINRAGQWVSVEVQYVDDWDASHSSIAQTGLAADESGTIKVTNWADADKPLMEEGESYRLDNVVTDSYQGNFSVQLQDSSEVIELDEEIEAGEETTETRGVLVDVNNGSGLIKRCGVDDCTRVVSDGRCAEHGEVDGEFDLRIKAVLDDGQGTQSVIFNRESTTELTGMTLDDAKKLAQKTLDRSSVIEAMLPDIVNRYYRIEGPQYGEYLMGEDFEQLGKPDTEQVDELFERL